MPFVKGDKNINRNGTPTLEEREEKVLQSGELDNAIRKLRRVCPKALNILIRGMEDETIPMKDRMKYAKDIYDLYLKTIGVDVTMKKAKTNSVDEVEDKPIIPAVVFKLHETKKTGTESK